MKRNIYTNEPCQPWELWEAECDARPVTTAEQIGVILGAMAFALLIAFVIALALR